MRKYLLLLALIAFTQNVKASGTDGYTSDIVIAEGEEITFESVLASQNTLRNDGWFDDCVTGSEIRVYIDYLPNDDSITLNTKVLDVKDSNSTPWTYKTSADPETHSSLEWFYLCQQSDTDTAYSSSDQYQKYIQYDTTQDLLTGYEYVSQQELSRVNALEYSNTYTANDSAGVQGARARAYNRALINNAVMLPNAGVMLNNLHITITNAQGQTTGQFDTNIVVKLDQILQQVIRIKSDTSTIVSELMFLANAFGFDGSVGSTTSNLAEFLGQWRTADGIWQGDILEAITNSYANIDYTPYLVLLDSYNGTNGVVNANNLLDEIRRISLSSPLSSIVGKGSTRRLLYGDWYDFVNGKISSLTSTVGWQGTESFLSDLDKWQVIRYYFDTAMQLRQASFETNVVSSLDFGRDWLNLATNDISSLPYWLNQQNFSSVPPLGVTNWQAQTRWSVLTNQYAQISLVGANASNSADNWDYFKRLEMLLAALVYKPDNLDGETPQDKTVSQQTIASDKQSEVEQSLDSLASSLSTDSLESSGQSLISLFTQFQSTLTQTFRPRYIVLFETGGEGQPTRDASSSDDLDIEITLDFEDERFEGVLDIIRTIFGMVWATIGLFACWSVMKKCYFVGYKIAVFCFAFFRRILGL